MFCLLMTLSGIPFDNHFTRQAKLHWLTEMKLALARQAAFAALLAIDRGAWSAEALAGKSAHLDTRDAGLASDIVFGTLRRRGELDALIGRYSKRAVERLDPAVRIALEMALYQIRFLDRVPGHAAVNDSVELARKAGKIAVVRIHAFLFVARAQNQTSVAVPAELTA